MARSSASTTRKVVGLGFLPEEARHGFLIDVPKGTSSSDMICITEHRGNDLDSLGARATQPPQPNAPGLRVVIDRARWLALADVEIKRVEHARESLAIDRMAARMGFDDVPPVHPIVVSSPGEADHVFHTWDDLDHYMRTGEIPILRTS